MPRTSRSTRRPAGGGAAGRAGRVHRRDVLGPLLALERAAGPVRVRLVVARRRAAGDRRCRSAWSTRRASATTRRSSRRRSARLAAMYPGRFWAALGTGEASNEHITGERLAAQGRAQRAAARVRRRHPRAAARRGGQPRRAGHGRPGAAVDAARRAAAADRRGGAAWRPPRWCAEWADGLITVNAAARAPARDDRRLPRRRRARPAAPAGAPELGPRPRTRRRGDRPRPVAQQRVPARRSAGTSTPPRLRRRVASTSRPTRCADGRQRLRRPGPARRAWLARVRRRSASTRSTCTTSARSRTAFIDAFGAQGPAPARTPSTGGARMRLTQTSDLWWKNAVVYCLDVETFVDGDGDGRGDFRGPRPADRPPGRARRHLPVADAVLSRRPTATTATTSPTSTASTPGWARLGDFVELVRTARDRGMRVIADLVVNHTSDQHPWFRAPARQPRLAVPRLVRLARRAAGGRRRGRRVPRPGDEPLGVRREDRRSTTCTGSTSTSPTSTSPTRRSATRSPGSWASGWSSGCPGSGSTRCRSCWRPTGQDDAAGLPDPHDYLRRPARVPAPAQRRGGAARRGQPALPGHDGVLRRTSDGDELTMCFDFIGMQQMYLSLARGDAGAAGRGAARAARAARGRRTGPRSSATTTS